MRIRRIFATILMFLCLALPVMPAYAVDVTSEACQGISDSAVCKEAQQGQNSNPLFGPEGILTSAVSLLGFVVGVLSVIVLIVAGIRFAINGSNAQEITTARNTVIYAVVGILVAILAQGVVQFILKKL